MNATSDVMHSFIKLAKNIAKGFLHFLFPVSCPVCGRPGVKLCPECRDYLPNEHAISVPKRLIPELFNGPLITRNINGLIVYSVSRYHDGIIRDVIHSFKYDGARELCRPLGAYMAQKFGECKAEYLIPVPLHLHSERGYNQTLELAEGMSDAWGVEIIDAALWTREVPRRALSKGRRDITYEDFRLTQDIYGKRIALVDDVCTSGMTLSCLAETCSRYGAEVVCAYTLASV